MTGRRTGGAAPFTDWSADCDDADASVHPGAEPTCDEVDEDCDGSLVDGFPDTDGDGVPDCVDGPGDDDDDDDDSSADRDGDGVSAGEDCDDGDPLVGPGFTEFCDAVDNDCDGDLLGPFPDGDGDGLPDCLVDPSDSCSGGCGLSWAGAASMLPLVVLPWMRRRA
jgi:hypothetical protein